MIEVKNLTHYYGDFRALHNVDFQIEKGRVAGLLGLNGAGKTTCLRILTGFFTPTSGECRIDGRSVFEQPQEVKRLIGYLPEQPPLYGELTVEDYLKFVARMRGMEEQFPEDFARVIRLTQLEPARRSLIRHLSLGYRKRVGIAQALIGSPPVLIFDEPISGLDPVQIVEVRKLIRELAGEQTILISSHILAEVSRTCDQVVIIHRGELAGQLAGSDLTNLEERFMEFTRTPVTEVGQ